MSTRAIKFLRESGIPFDVITYEHEEKGAEFAAKAIGFPPERTIKTLIVELAVDPGHKHYAMVLMPGDKQLVLKFLVKVFSVKRASMADKATAQRVTGYHVGGISPFGTKRPLPAVMEESLLAYDKVVINAGQRGVMLKMAPGDIVKTLECRVSRVTRL